MKKVGIKFCFALVVLFFNSCQKEENNTSDEVYFVYDETIKNLSYQAALLKDKLLYDSNFNNKDDSLFIHSIKEQEELHEILRNIENPTTDTLYKLNKYSDQIAIQFINEISEELNKINSNTYKDVISKLESFGMVEIKEKDSILASKLVLTNILNRELFVLETIDKMSLVTVCFPPIFHENIFTIDSLTPNEFFIHYKTNNLRIDTLKFDKFYHDKKKLNSSMLSYKVYNNSLIYIQSEGSVKGEYGIDGLVVFFNKNRGDSVKLSFHHNYIID